MSSGSNRNRTQVSPEAQKRISTINQIEYDRMQEIEKRKRKRLTSTNSVLSGSLGSDSELTNKELLGE